MSLCCQLVSLDCLLGDGDFMTNKELAEKILEIIGAQNISTASNCMTRLRIHLVNIDRSVNAKIKGLDGVLGLNYSGNELQIILGPGKATNVANEFKNLLSSKPQIGTKKSERKMPPLRNCSSKRLQVYLFH